MTKWIHKQGVPVAIEEDPPIDMTRLLDALTPELALKFLRGVVTHGAFMNDAANVVVGRAELEHPEHGPASVCTDFAGLDLRGFSRRDPGGAPLLWETMTFGQGETEGRYETLAQARLGHRAAVLRLLSRGYVLVSEEDWPLGREDAT